MKPDDLTPPNPEENARLDRERLERIADALANLEQVENHARLVAKFFSTLSAEGIDDDNAGYLTRGYMDNLFMHPADIPTPDEMDE